ncbi:MAG: GntR family transcriptional regulator [Desulfobacteraceae bacterium]|nr:GntR family transcriptional regulator [Desulfobacteraceae bacterium]
MDFHSNQAIYIQIADLICENILTGKWQPEERIPSVRELAVHTEVNPNTIMRTFTYLQEKNIIYNKRGIGYFVADDAWDTTRDLMKLKFMKNDLPYIYKTMKLLDITIKDLGDLFQQLGKERS